MFITKKHLSRRTFLQTAGATLALPFLESMIPALSAQAAPTPALAWHYISAARRNHGPLDTENRRRRLRVHADTETSRTVPAIRQRHQRTGTQSGGLHAVHSLSPTTWLSGVRPKATQGPDAFAGVTADQIAAEKIGQDTVLPSMELGTEDHSGLIGECDRDYGCIYMNTFPGERRPRHCRWKSIRAKSSNACSDREYGGTVGAQTRRTGASWICSCSRLPISKETGPQDQNTMTDYLESVREIERRIQRWGSKANPRLRCLQRLPAFPTRTKTI